MRRKVWSVIARIIRCIACLIDGCCPKDKKKGTLAGEDAEPQL